MAVKAKNIWASAALEELRASRRRHNWGIWFIYIISWLLGADFGVRGVRFMLHQFSINRHTRRALPSRHKINRFV
jgi:hypothetical protein